MAPVQEAIQGGASGEEGACFPEGYWLAESFSS